MVPGRMGHCGAACERRGPVPNLSRHKAGCLVCGGPLRLMQFVELHARSAFSFLEGASVPEALAYACARLQLPAMAVLDRNGLYGSPRFHTIAKSKGIQSHVGAELSVGENRASRSSYYPLLAASRGGY